MNIIRLLGNAAKKVKSFVLRLFQRIIKYREERYLEKIFRRHLADNVRVNHILNSKFAGAVGDRSRMAEPCNSFTYEKSSQKNKIFTHSSTGSDPDIAVERDLPDKKRYSHNDWWKVMLLRYGLALLYAKDKRVLDTCSGLGWGIYIVDEAAQAAAGVELDRQAIKFSLKNWPVNNTGFINGSVLTLPVKDSAYDVVLAFESIEHFELRDIKTYLKEIFRVLKPGGFLIGSSAFPDTRQEAEKLCARNKYHLYICCKEEMTALLLTAGFRKVKIFKNRLFFIAKK
jgi:2-polyprenyl-3-methyl-5-hydroxy-6-metoxy-1,4-benzoquinol methylase